MMGPATRSGKRATNAEKPEKDFVTYSLYVMYFPQLVAGPIERAANLLHQFHAKPAFNGALAAEGLRQMLWGFFKKIVIADRLAMVVKVTYSHSELQTGPALAIGTIFFAFQIYCDFSGYSDIAIGAARVMGFDLMKNFNRPYFARSISEFWTRWHISLSTWFKDYLYIPLGGNRVSTQRMYLNLAIVFVVSGLWHGANWTFITWGALHAFYLIFGLATKPARVKLLSAIGIAEHSRVFAILSVFSTFCLATYAWIFFRAADLHDAWYISTHLFTGWGQVCSLHGLKPLITAVGGSDTIIGAFNLTLGCALILFLELAQRKAAHVPVLDLFRNSNRLIRWGFYYLLIISILLIGVYDNQEFIYFQF